MTVTLGERAEALDILDGWIRENEDEVVAAHGELPAFLFELIEQAEGDFKAKAARVARYILKLDGEAAQVDAEIERLGQRLRVRRNAAARLREYLFRQMRATGVADASDPFVTVKLQKSPPKVTVDPSVTPFELQLMYDQTQDHNNEGGEERRQFVRYTPAQYDVDKRAVLAAHKAGEALPAGFAVTQDESLRIR
jgi:hypothetical protein